MPDVKIRKDIIVQKHTKYTNTQKSKVSMYTD